MGQKTNPIGFRLPVSKNWSSSWYADMNKYGDNLRQDLIVRKYFNKVKKALMISRVKIERSPKKLIVTVFSSRPSLIIKKAGQGITEIANDLKKLVPETDISLDIKEIKNADTDADSIANSIALQIEKRMPYLRAMKKAMELAVKNGVGGIKITCSGRLSGADIARHETISSGSVSLQTIRAKISYATSIAETTYGVIGIKVWILRK